MSRTWGGRKLLDHVLEGNEITEAMLDLLLLEKTPEGQFLEYKVGDELEKKNATAIVREYMSGFANADGGVLLAGIRERDNVDGKADPDLGYTVTGCPELKAPLVNWVDTAIEGIAHQLVPPHRCHVVAHRDGKVLVIAVARSPNLIAVGHNNRAVYFLRIGNQTVQVPDFLATDLVLGRRTHPVVALTASIPDKLFHLSKDRWQLQVGVRVVNESLVWIPDFVLGLVGYQWDDEDTVVRPSAGLLRYLNADRELHKWPGYPMFVDYLEGGNLAPFAASSTSMTVVLDIPKGREAVRWRAVGFVIPKNSVPTFVQIDCYLDDHGRVKEPKCRQLPPNELGVLSIGPD